MQENVEQEYTLWQLPTVSLLPEDTVELLQRLFGEQFLRLTSNERLALATASIEGKVTNQRIQEITHLHPHDIIAMLHNLVENKFFQQKGRGRGVYYFLANDAEVSLWEHAETSEHLVPPSEHLQDENAQTSEHLGELIMRIRQSGKIESEIVEEAILLLCNEEPLTLNSLAERLNRSATTLRTHYLNPLIREGKLLQLYPDQPRHPNQAYKAKKK